MEKLKIDNNKIYLSLILIIILAGVFMRILFYSYGRSFWVDECSLILNIIEGHNFFKNLMYAQAAPPLFMHLSQLIYRIGNFIGIKAEYSVRIFPLLSSILALPVFYLITKKVFNSKISIVLSLFLFTFNAKICYFSQEFKQYSSEVLFFITIIAAYLYIDVQKLTLNRKILLGLLLGISIWFSNAAAVASCAVGILLLVKTFKRELNWKSLLILMLPAALCAVLYLIVMHDTFGNSYLHEYWTKHFIKWNFSNLYPILAGCSKYFFGRKIMPLILALIGFLFFAAEYKKEKNLILVLPFLITLALSYLHIYPFGDRLILFLFPLIVIYIGKTTDELLSKNKYIGLAVACIVMLLSIYCFHTNYKQIIFKKYNEERVYDLLKISEQYVKPGDTIYLLAPSKNYKYYIRFFNFKDVKVIQYFILLEEYNQQNFYKHLITLPKGKYYFLMAGPRKNLMKIPLEILQHKYNGKLLYQDNKLNSIFYIEIK